MENDASLPDRVNEWVHGEEADCREEYLTMSSCEMGGEADGLEEDYLTMASCIEPSDSEPEEEEDDPDNPATVAGYAMEGLLGTGAFARVYVGRDPKTWNKVAIKQVLKVPAFAAGPVHEFAMVRRCVHKHIIEAVACVQDRGDQFLVFEMADEGDFYDRLEVAGERALTRGYGARFPTGICTRGCHWFPRLLA
jgi:serine/threonine protein kinase